MTSPTQTAGHTMIALKAVFLWFQTSIYDDWGEISSIGKHRLGFKVSQIVGTGAFRGVCVCVCVCVLSLIHISEPTRRA